MIERRPHLAVTWLKEMTEIKPERWKKIEAFEWLEKACEERSAGLIYIKVNPILDSLCADPRFADLLQRVGLPQ